MDLLTPILLDLWTCSDWYSHSFIEQKTFAIFVLGTKNDSKAVIHGNVYFLKELTLIGETFEVLCNYYIAELELEHTAKDSSLYFSH